MATDRTEEGLRLAAPDLLERLRSHGVSAMTTVCSRLSRQRLHKVVHEGALCKAPLRALLDSVRPDGTFETKVEEKRTACGRQYSSNYQEAAASTMMSCVRRFVYGAHWVDIDIVACHHTMLLNVAREMLTAHTCGTTLRAGPGG